MTEPTLPPEPAKDATADELEGDIAATRKQLGETIDALEDELNVSAQAKRKVEQTKTQLADRANSTKTQATNKIAAVRTQVAGKAAQSKAQVTDKVAQSKAQVLDKVAQTKAKVTGKKPDATTGEPVTDTVYPAEAGATDSSPRSNRVTFSGEASRTKAAAADQVKNITTRLASKIKEARARTGAADRDADAGRAEVVHGTTPAPEATDSTGSTRAAFTSTTAAVALFTACTRPDLRSALPVVGAVVVAVVVVGAIWRAARKTDLATGRE